MLLMGLFDNSGKLSKIRSCWISFSIPGGIVLDVIADHRHPLQLILCISGIRTAIKRNVIRIIFKISRHRNITTNDDSDRL
ncbi:hypothetical protein D3C85_1762870 [compost metagenome]